MKGLFTILALFILLFSCKESGVPLSKPSTFVRYFSDGNPNDAVDILETSDNAFLIMSYSKPSDKNTGWINLIKTSINGNIIWQTSIKSNSDADIRPSNFVAIKDNSGDTGYLIVGTTQNTSSFGSRLFIAKTDLKGAVTDSASYYTKSGDAIAYRNGTGVYLKGRGISQITSTNDFFVVAQVVNADLTTPSDSSMYMAHIDGSTLGLKFSNKYLGNTSDVVNRLYLNLGQTKLYWGATRIDGNGSHLNYVRSGFNAEPQPQNPDWAPTFPNYNPDNYVENDLSPYGNDYHGIIGTHVDQATGKYDSVIFALGNSTADVNTAALALKGYKLKNLTSQQGASICTTNNGFMLLYTEAVDAGGTNTDYTLAKIDLNGNPTKDWSTPKTFGGKYLDIGKRVLQTSDGGYVVLGTTILANVETVFFMKTDGAGNIQ